MDDALLLKKLRDYLFEQGKLSTVFKPPILSMEPYLSRALSRAINSIQRPDAARAEIATLRAQLGEARAFAEEAAKKYNELLEEKPVLRCAFCDFEYPEDTPATQHEDLTAHILECEKHPLRAERDRYKARLEAIKDARVHLDTCASHWCETCGCRSNHPAHKPDSGLKPYHRFQPRAGDCPVCSEAWEK